MTAHLSRFLRTPRSRKRPAHRCAPALELLERRELLDATYHNLAGAALSQNWSNAALITTDDDWAGVPSILGYRGDNGSQPTGVDPQTLLAPLDTEVDVNANLSDPDGFVSGGVAEFDGIANPAVALNGSGTADAPSLVLHLNTTGMTAVTISYRLRDLDGSADDAVMRVALQYRIGTSGDFVNVPGGLVADATTGGAATLETPVNVVLPSAVENQAQVQVRIITANAVGNDEWVGIDDISVSGTPATAGTLQFSAAAYSISEGDGTATLTVTRTGGSVGGVSVNYAVTGGTATAGSDYTVTTPGTLSLADGETTKTISVTVNDDGDPEPSETVLFTLSAPTGGATLGIPATTTLTIADNDGPGALRFSAAAYNAGENSGVAVITVLRIGGIGGTVTVDYTTIPGTATAGADYTPASGTLTFDQGENSKSFGVPLLNDTLLEGPETINLMLSSPTGGATLASPSSAVLTILDNDLLLNEVKVDPPGTDQPFEYLELRGTPGAALTNYYLLVLEGDYGLDGTGLGLADLVFSLGLTTPGANGLLLIKATTGGHNPQSAATRVVGSPFLDDGSVQSLENGTSSFVLVRSTTPLIAGNDYDSDGDGVLDLPVGASVVDAVGWSDNSSSLDRVYGGVSLTQSIDFPDAASRSAGNLTPLATAGWFNGDLVLTPGSTSVGYNPTRASANLVPGASLTPGGQNVVSFLAFGPDAGFEPRVRVFDPVTNTERYNFLAFDMAFTGGVRLALGDMTGDGVADLIAASGPGITSEIRFFDGASTGPAPTLLAAAPIFPGFSGGFFVAAGDLTGDGRDDLVISPDAGELPGVPGIAPPLLAIDLAGGALLGIAWVYEPTFTGGVRVAMGDVSGDGFADLIAAPGPGRVTEVLVISAAGLTSFQPFGPGYSGGAYVAVGDVNGDGKADVAVGSGGGAPAQVRIYDVSGASPVLLNELTAYAGFTGAVRVALRDVTADGRPELITTPGAGLEPRAKAFDPLLDTPVSDTLVYDMAFLGGVFVAG